MPRLYQIELNRKDMNATLNVRELEGDIKGATVADLPALIEEAVTENDIARAKAGLGDRRGNKLHVIIRGDGAVMTRGKSLQQVSIQMIDRDLPAHGTSDLFTVVSAECEESFEVCCALI